MKSLELTLALMVLSLSGCASVDTADKQAVVPGPLRSVYADFKYAPAMRVDNVLYLSGVVAIRKDGETSDTPAIMRAFNEIEMILAEAGADWSHAVDVTTYLTDFDGQIGPLWAVKENRVPAPYPAWTAIGVSRLYGGEAAIIEIKVTAHLPK